MNNPISHEFNCLTLQSINRDVALFALGDRENGLPMVFANYHIKALTS
ncbi:MAG: hypothetical protein AAFZ92_08215 [Pseudomonadota bacterium]